MNRKIQIRPKWIRLYERTNIVILENNSEKNAIS